MTITGGALKRPCGAQAPPGGGDEAALTEQEGEKLLQMERQRLHEEWLPQEQKAQEFGIEEKEEGAREGQEERERKVEVGGRGRAAEGRDEQCRCQSARGELGTGAAWPTQHPAGPAVR